MSLCLPGQRLGFLPTCLLSVWYGWVERSDGFTLTFPFPDENTPFSVFILC
jgi:hypothetical protein